MWSVLTAMFDGRVALDSQRELMETNQSRLLIRHYTQSGSWPTSEDMIGALGFYIKDYKGYYVHVFGSRNTLQFHCMV